MDPWTAHEVKLLIAERDELRVELKFVRRYALMGAQYAEVRHPLGQSANDCNDECLTAQYIRWAHDQLEKDFPGEVERLKKAARGEA